MANFDGTIPGTSESHPLPHKVRWWFAARRNHRSRVEFIDFLSKIDARILNDIGLDQRKESMNGWHFR